MKAKMIFMALLAVFLAFACQKKNSTEPADENIHPQTDIPWPSLADSPWPMHHHDPQSTGRSPYIGPQQGKITWKFNLNGPVGTSVAIGLDSTIYFATSYDTSEGYQGAYLYALAWNGNLKWRFKLSSDNFQGCSPLIGADGTIYIGTMDSDLKAINPDGSLKWKFENCGDIYQLGMNIGLDGVLYFVDENNYLYAVNQNGILKWKIGESYKFENSTPSGISFSPDGETLYLGYLGTAESDTNKGLIAVDQNGQVKWLFKSEQLEGTPLVDNSGNIFFCAGKSIFSVDPEGQLRWKYLAANVDSRDITIDYDGNIYVSLWSSSTQPILFSFDNDGDIRWQKDISGSGHITSSLICDSEGIIYYASDSGVYAVFSNGKIKWKALIGENGWNCPALAQHFLFVGTWFRGPGREFYKLN